MTEQCEGCVQAGTGTPIVMLPGMEGAKEFWSFQIEALSGEYRAVACDLARRKPGLSSTIDDYARDALSKMDALGIESAVIVGESMGGMVSQHIAINYPARVRALVLCNTVDRARGRRWGFGLNMFTLATFVHQLAFLPFLSDDTRRAILRWVGRHRGFVMDPSPGMEWFMDYLVRYGTACGPGCYVDRIIAGSKADNTARLPEISVPTLVLRGTEDRLVSAEATLQLVGRIPGAELALVEGGGHCCTHTCPEQSSRIILEFLDRAGLQQNAT